METIAKRAKEPMLSRVGEHVLAQYERRLRVKEDLTSVTIRNYLSNLRQFIAWCESLWQQGREDTKSLVATVKKKSTARDQAIIVLMLHTGLREREVCTLTRAQISLGKRSGSIIVHGKRNKYQEVPLNATARDALEAYDPFLTRSHAQDATPLFLSEKRHAQRSTIEVFCCYSREDGHLLKELQRQQLITV